MHVTHAWVSERLLWYLGNIWGITRQPNSGFHGVWEAPLPYLFRWCGACAKGCGGWALIIFFSFLGNCASQQRYALLFVICIKYNYCFFIIIYFILNLFFIDLFFNSSISISFYLIFISNFILSFFYCSLFFLSFS